jgi:hypothetical protein
MSNEKFKRDFAKILARAGGKADQVIRKVVLDVGKAIINRSPVDTGRFRGNWNYASVSINTSTSGGADKTGSSALARIQAGLTGWATGQTIYITNSLPYAVRLENGWSQQAPSGMVRLTVVEFRQYIAKAAREVRSV